MRGMKDWSNGSMHYLSQL